MSHENHCGLHPQNPLKIGAFQKLIEILKIANYMDRGGFSIP